MDYAADYAAGMDRLKRALAENDHEWLSKNYPGAWPWPVSGGAQCKRTRAETADQQGSVVSAGGDFDADSHDAFMKGLG